MICAFEVTKSSALSVTTMPVIHSKGRQNVSFIFEGLCIRHICSPVKDNLIASSHVSAALNDSYDLLQLGPYFRSLALISVSNYSI